MESSNLIHGEKPQFGNPKHIKYIKDKIAEQEQKHKIQRGKSDAKNKYFDIGRKTTTYNIGFDFTCPVCDDDDEIVFRGLDFEDIGYESFKCSTCDSCFRVDSSGDQFSLKN